MMCINKEIIQLLTVHPGVRMGKPMLGVFIVIGIMRCTFSRMVVGKPGKIASKITICGILSCVIMASDG